MGAAEFIVFSNNPDPDQAFMEARSSAQWESGHGGYTGTIAEKDNYIVIQRTPLEYVDAVAAAQHLLNIDDERIADKWGPAGSLRVKDEKRDGWVFVGWASS